MFNRTVILALAGAILGLFAIQPIHAESKHGMSHGQAFNECRNELGPHRTDAATRACVARKMRGG